MYTLEELPAPFIIGVFCALTDLKDIYNLQLTSKRFYFIGKSRSVWTSLIKRDTGLDLQLTAGFDENKLINYYMFAKEKIENLRFWGVYTDGGCDEDFTHYWVDNMFVNNHWSCYCSDICTNINTYAILVEEINVRDKELIEDRDYMLKKCRYPAARLFNSRLSQGVVNSAFSVLQGWALAELECFFISLYDGNRGHGQLGTLLESGLRRSELPQERQKMDNFINKIKMNKYIKSKNIMQFSKLDEKDRRILYDTDFTKVIQDINKGQLENPYQLIGIISNLSISRKGTFSCPLAAAVIFIGTLPNFQRFHNHNDFLDFFKEMSESEYSKTFNDLTDYKLVLDMVSQKKLPKINATNSAASGQWIEFDQGSCEKAILKPLVWFKFWDLQEYFQYNEIETTDDNTEANKGTQNRNNLEIKLKNKVSGNFICAKLINSENLMSEFQDRHPSPNIDIRNISLSGKKIKLMDGISLKL